MNDCSRVLASFLILIGGTCGAWAQDFVWAGRLGGTSTDQGNGVAVDASGNVYTVGSFAGTADFDPGPGTFNLTSAGGEDPFVSKLDSAGNFVWARRLGGASIDQGSGVAVDANGNVYIVGTFAGTADFDPGPGTFNLTSAGNTEIFVSKLDGAGNFVWARRLGGTSNDQGNGVAVDAKGNVFTVGLFAGTADFDPGTATFNLTSAGNTETFISKLDGAGNFAWAVRLGGTSTDQGNGVAVDATGNVYTVGSFAGTADFDPGPGTFNLTSAGGEDPFVSKLDAAGNFVWARRLGGASIDQGNGVAVDPSGEIITVGTFAGTADFDPGAATFNLTAAGNTETFVSKLDRAGNFVWARRLGGASNDQGNGVAVDASGNVHTVGSFAGTADFDPGPGTFNLTSAGNTETFVSKLKDCGLLSLRLEPSGSDTRLTWCGPAESTGYDVVRGDLGVLRSSLGDFSLATKECLIDNQPVPSLIFSATPASANGFWFLERCEGCQGRSTYSSGALSEFEDPDPGIAASGHDCP